MFFARRLRARVLKRGARDEVWSGEIDCVTADRSKDMVDVVVWVPRCLGSREVDFGNSEPAESGLILLEFIKTQRASQPRIRSLTKRLSSSRVLSTTPVMSEKACPPLMLPSPMEVPKALSLSRFRGVPKDVASSPSLEPLMDGPIPSSEGSEVVLEGLQCEVRSSKPRRRPLNCFPRAPEKVCSKSSMSFAVSSLSNIKLMSVDDEHVGDRRVK